MEAYRGRVVLVTGGAGFIGSNLVDALLAHGATVRVLDNLVTGKLENLAAAKESVTFIHGDIRDEDACAKACADVDIVFHEAAMVSVPLSMEKPHENHANNITGMLNVLVAAANAGVKRFVYASSAAVYGDRIELPKKETMPRHYPSPYALSKGVDEDYAELWASKATELGKGMTCIGLRYFNVYGPRQDPKSPYSGVISIFADRIRNNQDIAIFGDGENTRDFVFVGDVVQANLRAGVADMAASAAPFAVYNVGTGGRTSLNKLADTMKGLTGSMSKTEYKPPRPGDIVHSQSSIKKIQKALNYQPKFELAVGLNLLLQSIPEAKKGGRGRGSSRRGKSAQPSYYLL